METLSLTAEPEISVPVTARRGRPRQTPEGADPKWKRATDSRGRPVEGLWERNGRYYCQMRVPGLNRAKHFPLFGPDRLPVRTISQAIAARDELRSDRRRGRLPGPMITPPFNEYVLKYLTWLEETQAKSPLTILKERCALGGWAEFLGSTRLNQITRSSINKYVLERSKSDPPLSNRTINLDIVALKHLLVFAKDEGWLKHELPTDNWKPLKYSAPKRQLIEPDAVERLCAAALATKVVEGKTVPKYEYGQMFADYIRLLAYSGARRMAGLSARWELVDWGNRQISFDTKFDKRVVVDFNDKLEAHLRGMFERRADPNNPWLFPSPRPGDVTGHMVSPHKTFNAVRKDAGLPNLNLHDLRHWFISNAVMSGIDFMTIARWVGHADGGILIGKVYGHLSNEHAQAAAKKINFGAATQQVQPAASSTLVDLSKLSATELLALAQERLKAGA